MGIGIKIDQRAFTLIEIIAAMTIFSMVLAFGFSVNHFFQGKGQVDKARQRMQTIVAASQSYFLSHENLPTAADNTYTVPVNALNLDAKYRSDSWGQPFRFIVLTNDRDILIDPFSVGGPPGAIAMVVIKAGTATSIRALDVDGQQVAGLIISAGPNQIFEPDTQYGKLGNNESPRKYQPTPRSDDIYLAIDVSQQAARIALSELKVLNAKAQAFEERFLGFDNNENGQYDEDGCGAIPYPAESMLNGGSVSYTQNTEDECLNSIDAQCNTAKTPDGSYFPEFIQQWNEIPTWDYNCGMPTLDCMKARYCDLEPVDGSCDGGYYLAGYYAPSSVRCYFRLPEPDGGSIFRSCPPPDVTAIPKDYYRIPYADRPKTKAERSRIDPDACHWGLVKTQWGDGDEANETDADQARSFIYCLNKLPKSAIVDPWLNGYIWGCGQKEYGCQYKDGNGQMKNFKCTNDYSIGDPRYHHFFSAGPNGLPAAREKNDITSDDII